MKALQAILWVYLLSAGSALAFTSVHADNDKDYLTINGVVKDKNTRKDLEFVTVSIPGTHIGTVTNEEGRFSLKVKDSLQATVVELSHVGYNIVRVSIGKKDMRDGVYYLTPVDPYRLKEVVVRSWESPEQLVAEALKRVGGNYSNRDAMLTGFYRETSQKKNQYITISEAILHIYKTDYTTGVEKDGVELYKGRQLLSQKRGDTLAVKLVGGPNMSVYVDFVKNPEILFEESNLSYYQFKMGAQTRIGDRPQYVVSFVPQVELPYSLMKGVLYIDQESLSFTKAEVSLDMKDRDKATRLILKKKPKGLRFRPEELTFLITYKQDDGMSRLNYIRNEIRFKCDWKRKLFATSYTVISEMVVTESVDEHMPVVSRKNFLQAKESLSDKVMNFYDADFWGAYNIIEPTESLDNAVGKLMKQYKDR